MEPVNKDTIQYRARIFKDKALMPQIEEELKVLVQTILGDKRTLKIEYYKDLTYADGKTKLFDPYPSCHDWQKKYCGSHPTQYRGTIPELGYGFFEDDKISIYCDVIKTFIGKRIIVPFSY